MRRSFLTCSGLVLLAACSPSDGGGDDRTTGILPSTTTADETTTATTDPTGDGDEDTNTNTGDGDGDTDTTNPSTTGDGDGDDADSGGTGPKFDLSSLPDGGELPGGPMGIPETCAIAEQVESAVGCLFFTLDLDNLSSGETQPYGIIVSNVQEDNPAEVVVEKKQGGNWVNVAGPQSITALDSQTFLLPDNHMESSGLAVGGAYRVTSDVPVVAYEFNPIDGQASYTSDASLLLPVASYDYIYQILGYRVTIGYGSYITIMAAYDGTEVEITPSYPTAAGPGIPAGQPNVPFVVQLDEGDVAQISTESANNTMMGTTVLTDEDHPVGVLTATECTNTGQGACDHMEEMLTGVRFWGTEFVSARMPIRQVNSPEQTEWQIYASEDNTTITLSAAPGVTGLPQSPLNLDKGEFVEFATTGPVNDPGDYHIEADKPIGVMGYLLGVNAGDGDPAMVQVNPVQQFLPRYVVLVPGTWINDFLVLTRYAGATVEVDGVAVPDMDFIPVGNGDYEVARISIPDGVHTVDGLGDPCSVTVVGFDSYDSYAYLGGVGTSVINPDPQG